jgi:DNA repair protein RecN (Recombination protein N)
VLCVTHLPQIAAHADAHFGIRKVERAGRTVTEVRRLSDDDRVEELAAMIGGPAAGAAATASARDLLDRAAAFRASRVGPAGTRR